MRVLFLSRSTLFTQPGGDTVQMEESARALRELGVFVDIKLKGDSIHFKDYQIVHFFNIGRPADIIPYLDQIKCPIVISSIWVQYAKPNRIGSALEYGKTIGRWVKGNDKAPGLKYLYFGQQKSISILAHRAKQIITTTTTEADRITQYLNPSAPPVVVPPGLNQRFFETLQPNNKCGIIAVGRIEKLKNQLTLINAVKNLKDPVTIIGNAAKNQPSYFDKCKAAAGPLVSFKPYVPPKDLLTYYQNAEILVLPSLFETFGLVALEAWSQGCKLILSNALESVEIFKDKALFFDPKNPSELTEKINQAKKLPHPKPLLQDLEKWHWSHTAEKLKEIYNNSI